MSSRNRLGFVQTLALFMGLLSLGVVTTLRPSFIGVGSHGMTIGQDAPFIGTTGKLQQAQDENFATTATIGYAVSITKCQPADMIVDQAAILLFSIHRSSLRNALSKSKYDYQAYAFVHPEASNCTEVLERIGYNVLVKETPVLKSQIEGTLKEYVHEASCCAEKEFLKLYAYTLTKHPLVTHMDLDSIVLKPMDKLYDSMIGSTNTIARSELETMWVKNASSLPSSIEGAFTRDYNLVTPGRRQPHQIGVQGGFLVVKPDAEVFEQYRRAIITGNYTRVKGWGGELQYGGYYGAAQIQGLCAYFFGHLRPGTAVELNRCYYNAMIDNPRANEKGFEGKCRTLEKNCEDCRDADFDKIKTTHFTVCSKPWWCFSHPGNQNRENHLGGSDGKSFRLCMATHSAWFRTRWQLEETWARQSSSYNVSETARAIREGATSKDTQAYGFCGPITALPRYERLRLPAVPLSLGTSDINL